MAPGDERRQREGGKTMEVTQELCAGTDEHMIEGGRDEHSAPSTVSLAGACLCSLR